MAKSNRAYRSVFVARKAITVGGPLGEIRLNSDAKRTKHAPERERVCVERYKRGGAARVNHTSETEKSERRVR